MVPMDSSVVARQFPLVDCPPQFNTDVAGVGIRVSFYAQSFLLALLCIRSGSLADVTGSLSTLIVTNIVMTVTSLILGFRTTPDIALQDVLVILYLLSLSWLAVSISVFTFNRFQRHNKLLSYLSVFHSFLIFAFVIAVLVKWDDFGSTPNCNEEAVVVIFRTLSTIDAGRKAGWAMVIIAITLYTFVTIIDMRRGLVRESRRGNGSAFASGSKSGRGWFLASNSDPDLEFNGRIIVLLIFAFVLLPLAIVNTELLVKRNITITFLDPSSWDFAQVVPAFFAIHPLVNVILAFKKYGFKSRKHHRIEDVVADGEPVSLHNMP